MIPRKLKHVNFDCMIVELPNGTKSEIKYEKLTKIER